MAIQVGDTLGDYEVIGVLGAGGMGRVFRVRNTLSGREEAMKIVLPDLDEKPDLAERFLREIKVHASLDHPNIAKMHTALRISGQIVMVLELVDGISLGELVRRGPVPVPDSIVCIDQVLSALDFAHGRGVVHRDIKPANILITRDRMVKLTDFGIARAATESHLTLTGTALGSLPYMSPEQIRSGPVDGRSDIYSLGATFYEMVTGQRPIQGESAYAMMNAQLTEVPAPPAQVTPSVPLPISDAIMKALAKDPARRFQTARDFQAVLRGSVPPPPPLPVHLIAADELARIQARFSRVMGPIAPRLVADAARKHSTVADLCAALGAFIADERERAAFLKSCNRGGPITATNTAGGNLSTSSVTRTMGERTWDPALLARASQALAAYIGPIAKVMVSRAAKAARTEEELYAALAAEIPEERDRKRFTAAIRLRES